MNKYYKGFAIAQIMMILLVSSILIIATLPMMTVKQKEAGGNNTDVISCVVKELASNLSSTSCANTVTSILQKRANAYNSLISYIDASTPSQNDAARKVLAEACKQGGEKACKYFLNQCLLDVNNCNDASNYDLNYFLSLAHNDSSLSRVTRLIESFYKLSNPKITSAVENACTSSSNSLGCKLIVDKCESGNQSACSYFANRCKDSGICDVAGSDLDFRYLLLLNNKHKAAKILTDLTDPIYMSGNANIIAVADNACITNPYSVSCAFSSIEETNCKINNDDVACNSVANQCANNNNLKKCSTLVTACNSGKTNACKYGYIYDINRSCLQIKNKTGGLFGTNFDNKTNKLARDNTGATVGLYCDSDWTRIVSESFSTLAKDTPWLPSQTVTNRVRNNYTDEFGTTYVRDSHWILGGQNVLSGTGYSADMHLEKTFDLYNIPHAQVKFDFYTWYCGPWSGEKTYVYYNDLLLYTSGALTSSVNSWTTWDQLQYCKNFHRNYPIDDSTNSGKVRIEADLSAAPTDKSLGISYFYLYVR